MKKKALLKFLAPFQDDIEIDITPMYGIDGDGKGCIKNRNTLPHPSEEVTTKEGLHHG